MKNSAAVFLLCCSAVGCKQNTQQAVVNEVSTVQTTAPVQQTLVLPAGVDNCLNGPYMSENKLVRARKFTDGNKKSYDFTCWSEVSTYVKTTKFINYTNSNTQYIDNSKKAKYDFLVGVLLSVTHDRVKQRENLLITQESINIIEFAVELLQLTAEDIIDVSSEIYSQQGSTFSKELEADFSLDIRTKIATEFGEIVSTKRSMEKALQELSPRSPKGSKLCYFIYGNDFTETNKRIKSWEQEIQNVLKNEGFLKDPTAPFYMATCTCTAGSNCLVLDPFK